MGEAETVTLSASELSDLETSLMRYKQTMLDRSVDPADVRVVITTELRSAIGREEWPRFLKRMEEKLGHIIDVPDAAKEAHYAYISALRVHEGGNARQRNLVLGVGPSGSRLLFGRGTRKMESALTGAAGVLPLGFDTLAIEDVFSPIDTALTREVIQGILARYLSPETRYAAKDRVVFVPGDAVLDLLAELEKARPDGGAHLYADGLSLALLEWYLAPDGLAFLKAMGDKRTAENLSPEKKNALPDASVKRLVARLLILRELAVRLGIQVMFFGGAGGQEAGMLDEVIRTQIARRMDRFGQALHRRYRREYPEALSMLREIFPDFKIRGRAKDAPSIADKLQRKALRTGRRKQVMLSLDEAGQHIGDGHGLRLVLENTARPMIARVCDQLIAAIRDGRMQVLEINNFHAGGMDALPYLTEEDIARIRMAARQAVLAFPDADRPPEITLLDGPDATKPLGYTTSQLNIRLRNPVSNQYDLLCELQVRGAEVERFSAAEHLIHDFRRGKDPYRKHEGIRRIFEPEVSPLLRAIQEMSEERFAQFTDYLSGFYLHCRRLESGQIVPEPELPAGMPEVCHIDNLKRLSRLQKELIARYRARPLRTPPGGGQEPPDMPPPPVKIAP